MRAQKVKCLPYAKLLAVSDWRWGPGLLLCGVEALNLSTSPTATCCLFPDGGRESFRVLGALCRATAGSS